MVKKMKLITKKMMKVKRGSVSETKIERQPLSPEERARKLQEDRLNIAKRYEEMHLYDEAIKYYKKLGLLTDVARVVNIKNEIYLTKAREFELKGKYEDAARLYENLKMEEDFERVKRLMGEEGMESEPLGEGSGQDSILDIPPGDVVTKNDRESATKIPNGNELESDLELKQTHTELQEQPEGSVEISEETDTKSSKKIFKICPYCGEELNLPKKPNFCPYCQEKFV